VIDGLEGLVVWLAYFVGGFVVLAVATWFVTWIAWSTVRALNRHESLATGTGPPVQRA
jgi:hypothetical protein